MINFRHHLLCKGFGFIEIMVALSIMGIAITTFFAVQGAVVNRIVNNMQRLRQVYNLKHFLIDAELEMQQKKTFQNPISKSDEILVEYNYLERSIVEDSSLARFSGLKNRTIKAHWTIRGVNRDMMLMTYVYHQDEKETKK